MAHHDIGRGQIAMASAAFALTTIFQALYIVWVSLSTRPANADGDGDGDGDGGSDQSSVKKTPGRGHRVCVLIGICAMSTTLGVVFASLFAAAHYGVMPRSAEFPCFAVWKGVSILSICAVEVHLDFLLFLSLALSLLSSLYIFLFGPRLSDAYTVFLLGLLLHCYPFYPPIVSYESATP